MEKKYHPVVGYDGSDSLAEDPPHKLIDTLLHENEIPQELDDIKLITRTDDIDEIYTVKRMIGFKKSIFRTVLYYILCLLTVGILPLFAKWFTWLKTYMTHYKCPQKDADVICMESRLDGNTTVCPVQIIKYKGVTLKMITYRHSNYIYDNKAKIFRTISFDVNYTHEHIQEHMSQGIDDSVRTVRKLLFGENLIKVPIRNCFLLLIDQVLHPFYIFQIFSIIIWMYDEYYVYAGAIFIMASISALTTLFETRRNLQNLAAMATFKCKVNRFKSKTLEIEETVSSEELVPGDVIEIPNNFVLPCDVALLAGQCVVNEAMLTGEATPIIKIPLSPDNDRLIYDVENAKNYTLYSGTKVIQTRLYGGEKVIGLVCRTGYETAKGKLVLSILFPKPNQFKFYSDSLKFIGLMFIVGMLGFIYAAVQLGRSKVPIESIIKKAADIITITVPPALPVAMTAGVAFAIRRMKHEKIFCISPPRVNVAGMIDLMCFDKTGTLTEEGLDLYGVSPIIEGRFGQVIAADKVSSMGESEPHKLLFYGLACCHGLTQVDEEIVGDPLELKIFEATKWVMEEPEITDYKIESAIPKVIRPPNAPDEISFNDESLLLPFEFGILRSFEFSSKLQRQSVIVKNLQTSEVFAFVKGSPEMIRSLCKSESIPKEYSQELFYYAHNGYRVIAYGYKKLEKLNWRQLHKLPREAVESELIFLGFVVMQNKIKQDTRAIISILHKANIRSVMVTGDNPYTAISVSRRCKIVKESEPVFLSIVTKDEYGNERITWKDVDSDQTLDPLTLLPSNGVKIENYSLAVIGDAFEIILDNPDILKYVLISSNIYARMTPAQKMRLIEEYQKIGYYTSMCGDGANDCGALKAAHVGVSLSQAEASIAAPFTSTVPSIACVPKIIREGRASLSSSYQMFKYMSTYSYIQFIAIIILYSINSNLGDFQFLWVDLFIILPIAALMGNTGATNVLVKERPPSSLISKHVLLSLFGQLSLAAGFQIFAYFDLLKQSFYKPISAAPGEKNILCYETSTIFLLSSFQTLSVALAYSISKPFKKPLHTNYSYTFMLLLLFVASSYIILYPHQYVMDILELMNFPIPYRIRLYIITLIHLMASWTFERVLILGPGATLLDKLRKPTPAQHEILAKEFAYLKKREGINIVISK